MRPIRTPTALELFALCATTLVAAPEPAQAGPNHGHLATGTSSVSTSKLSTRNTSKLNATNAALRDLWVGHVFWVRNVVTASLAGDPTAIEVSEKQVVANAQAIAGAVEPFYGSDAKNELFRLLAGHYAAVKGYLDATLGKDEKKKSASTKDLLSNANEIAVFLSNANPYLAKDAVEGLLQAHGGHHISQINQLVSKDYSGESQTWTEMVQHMYVIADALGNAIAKQFPEKFQA